MLKMKSKDMAQPKTRWSKIELITIFSEEKYNIAEASRVTHQKAFPEMGEFILVPSPYLNMISIISAREWDKGKNGIGEIMHDKIFG